MGLDPETAIRWTTPEQAMYRISTRNKRLRIIEESLYIKCSGNDPIKAWDTEGNRFVYVRKQDWVKASPAIRTIEAAVLLRMTKAWFKKRRDASGVVPKRSNHHKIEGVPKQGPQTYYSINDLVEISKSTINDGRESGFAGEHEIRHMFSQGYVSYKRLTNGDFVPIWSESIY